MPLSRSASFGVLLLASRGYAQLPRTVTTGTGVVGGIVDSLAPVMNTLAVNAIVQETVPEAIDTVSSLLSNPKTTEVLENLPRTFSGGNLSNENRAALTPPTATYVGSPTAVVGPATLPGGAPNEPSAAGDPNLNQQSSLYDYYSYPVDEVGQGAVDALQVANQAANPQAPASAAVNNVGPFPNIPATTVSIPDPSSQLSLISNVMKDDDIMNGLGEAMNVVLELKVACTAISTRP